MKAVIFSVVSPVLGSFKGVLAKTVKISAKPPLLFRENINKSIKKKKKTNLDVEMTCRCPLVVTALSRPDPDLAAVHDVELPAGRGDRRGSDRSSVRTAGWFGQAEGSDVFPCRHTQRTLQHGAHVALTKVIIV